MITSARSATPSRSRGEWGSVGSLSVTGAGPLCHSASPLEVHHALAALFRARRRRCFSCHGGAPGRHRSDPAGRAAGSDRFRFLDASNARFYDLKLFESDASGQLRRA